MNITLFKNQNTAVTTPDEVSQMPLRIDHVVQLQQTRQKCKGPKPVTDVATGSGTFTCNLCLQHMSTKDALRRHQQTQSCAKRAIELAQGYSPPLKKYSKIPTS